MTLRKIIFLIFLPFSYFIRITVKLLQAHVCVAFIIKTRDSTCISTRTCFYSCVPTHVHTVTQTYIYSTHVLARAFQFKKIYLFVYLSSIEDDRPISTFISAIPRDQHFCSSERINQFSIAISWRSIDLSSHSQQSIRYRSHGSYIYDLDQCFPPSFLKKH